MGAAVVDTWVGVDAALECRQNSDPFVPASSSYLASEVDGFVDVGGRFGVEHRLPRGSFREWPTWPRSQDAVSMEGVGVDGPTPTEALGVQFERRVATCTWESRRVAAWSTLVGPYAQSRMNTLMCNVSEPSEILRNFDGEPRANPPWEPVSASRFCRSRAGQDPPARHVA